MFDKVLNMSKNIKNERKKENTTTKTTLRSAPRTCFTFISIF